jgi:hypothetical protein
MIANTFSNRTQLPLAEVRHIETFEPVPRVWSLTLFDAALHHWRIIFVFVFVVFIIHTFFFLKTELAVTPRAQKITDQSIAAVLDVSLLQMTLRSAHAHTHTQSPCFFSRSPSSLARTLCDFGNATILLSPCSSGSHVYVSDTLRSILCESVPHKASTPNLSQI